METYSTTIKFLFDFKIHARVPARAKKNKIRVSQKNNTFCDFQVIYIFLEVTSTVDTYLWWLGNE